MWYSKLILFCYISLAASKPSTPNKSSDEAQKNVEIIKQQIKEIVPLSIPTTKSPTINSNIPPSLASNNHEETQRKLEENTKEILAKIAEVNANQGLPKKTPVKQPSYYFQFPFSYSRAQAENTQPVSNNKVLNILANPILEYLKTDKDHNLKSTNSRSSNVYQINSQNTNNPNVDTEDSIPGQYIKRKITHYQAVLVPNPYGMPMVPDPYGMENRYYSPGYSSNVGYYPPHASSSAYGNSNDPNFLEKQTIENIKNLINNNRFQYPQSINPLVPSTTDNPSNTNPQLTESSAKKSKQNWNWPGAGLFPIYIRDPFLQMYYAVTNMVEYGPNAGNEGPCKLTPRPQAIRTPITKIKTNMPGNKPIVGTNNIQLLSRANNDEGLDIEEVDISDNDLMKVIINVPNSDVFEGREIKNQWMLTNKITQNDTKHYPTGKLDFPIIRMPSFMTTTTTTTTPNQILHLENDTDDETSMIEENEKSDDISVSNEGSRKVFSKDNTGNGIFIHKLKVKQGGVAIAGPGGIATAGSGGTAIVGPNGVAYTHPNGLAIAGSGSKVVAVDPAIDLNDIINNSTQNAKQQFLANTRFGKVVAIGPAIYYNTGETNLKE